MPAYDSIYLTGVGLQLISHLISCLGEPWGSMHHKMRAFHL